MEDLFGQIECRTKSDSIVMRILRSAMDEAHENLQSKDGPIQFLHDRSMFYELAAILVDGGLNIVQEQTDIPEDNCNKILKDLTEIKEWLRGRIQDMKQLIFEKDKELNEKLENELMLQQSLDLKDKEILYLHEKIHDLPISNQEDIVKLKSSVDQQVSYIKQKLEEEKKMLNVERRTRKTRVSSPNLSFDFLDKERNGSPVFTDDVVDKFSNVKSELSRPNQNVLIRRMSSDIDVLKETLDLAFGRMQITEAFPSEKQWRFKIEKDVESILVRGFVRDLKRGFDVEFIDDMRNLCYELKDFFSINDVQEKGSLLQCCSSEPLSDVRESEADEKQHHVAKMIKSHESIIRKQVEKWNLMRKEGSVSRVGKEKGNNRLERRIQDAIKRLENLSRISKSNIKTKRSSNVTPERLEVETEKLKEQRDGLCFQNSVMEGTYELLLRGMVTDFSIEREKNAHDNINSVKEFDIVIDELQGLTSTQIMPLYLESTIREDLYMLFFGETVQQWKNITNERRVKEMIKQTTFDETIIESLLKEYIYMVFFKEMVKAWKSEKDDRAIESLIREDIYQFIIIEAVKDSHVHAKQLDFQERTPRARKILNADNFQEGTPRSGDENLIQKLDSLLRCLEAEEDLMLSANSEIKEHNVNNSLVILNCEEMDERDAIEWLITDDESTFNSVSAKLERALQQLYTSKELLVELEQSLEFTDEFKDNFQQEGDDQVSQMVPYDNILAIVMQFQGVLGNVEHVLLENLESKCLRLEVLKRQVETLVEPVALITRRKLLYKKAFLSRCHNLKLAEIEVDLLGDQVESLLCLLERIYVELNQNAKVFSGYFEVYDILKLIKRQLNTGRSCKPKS